MPTKTYNKLVRDQIPEIIRAKGGVPKVRVLSDAEFAAALRQKLVEEAQELKEARAPDDVLNELSDVLELVRAVAQNANVSLAKLEKSRQHKFRERGGFSKKLFLKSVDGPLGD